MEGYYTTQQVADLLAVTRQCVHNWRRRRTAPLEAIRVGNMWLYPTKAVETMERLPSGRPAAKRELIAS